MTIDKVQSVNDSRLPTIFNFFNTTFRKPIIFYNMYEAKKCFYGNWVVSKELVAVTDMLSKVKMVGFSLETNNYSDIYAVGPVKIANTECFKH